jgi:hypothetical protein
MCLQSACLAQSWFCAALATPVKNQEVNQMRDDDPLSNASGNPHFSDIIDTRLARRKFLGGGVALSAAASMGGIGDLLSAVPAHAGEAEPLLGFTGIPVSSADAVVVPSGYSARLLVAWGDPVSGARHSPRTLAAAPPTRLSNGACTTTGWSTSRSTARRAAC